jgi:hypothetical protein
MIFSYEYKDGGKGLAATQGPLAAVAADKAPLGNVIENNLH